ncbi:hypothetical protein Taro_001452, partial [Colocasia esculenta]|nr:hypothetical protein [Colocasia esculenta]
MAQNKGRNVKKSPSQGLVRKRAEVEVKVEHSGVHQLQSQHEADPHLLEAGPHLLEAGPLELEAGPLEPQGPQLQLALS